MTRSSSASVCLGIVLLLGTLATDGTLATTLSEQRDAFRSAYKAAERGDWSVAQRHRSLLEDYVLWPDLRAAWLRRQLADDQAIVRFLAGYGGSPPAEEIRYLYARRLGRRGHDAGFLAIYDEHFSQAGDAVLDCFAAAARLRSGDESGAAELARRLWLIGHSQVEECDVVFGHMRNNGTLTRALFEERYALAIASEDFLLARYLARSLDERRQTEVSRWLRAKGDAAAFLRAAATELDSPVYRAQLAFAARRLAVSDPVAALTHWKDLREKFEFPAALESRVLHQAALWAGKRRIADDHPLLADLDPRILDDEVIDARLRNALRDQNWSRVTELAEGLDEEREEWLFWRGIALEQTGRRADGMLVLSRLAAERSFHGFLAADHLDLEYAIDPVEVPPDDATLAALEMNPGLIRARELYLVGLDGRARSAWNVAVRGMDEHSQAQAALLADRWGWPSRAIAMAARAGYFDSLDIRYPLPHLSLFRQAAADAGISESWTYGIARNESIFMRDIRSRAGAIGLMQLMPDTGKSTAQEISLPYRGVDTLIDPASNIRLGTTYLGKMHARFGQHAALATAAYNAGPWRVARWLPDQPVDARIWIETIPFRETRGYVQRVLASEVIFAWRLTGEIPRISDRLPAVMPPQVARAASSD